LLKWGQALAIAEEPSIWSAAKKGRESYRCLSLNLSMDTIISRLDIVDGKGTVIEKRVPLSASYSLSGVTSSPSHELTPREFEGLEAIRNLPLADLTVTKDQPESKIDTRSCLVERALNGVYSKSVSCLEDSPESCRNLKFCRYLSQLGSSVAEPQKPTVEPVAPTMESGVKI